ncbi:MULTISPECIES: hypothetical protein [unclassified Bradyrhizobium]|uniref:hypothetical protein n=1 Tax=unclassified Bradyrhizobium TaxID=2631580 RepID=UPI00211E6A08|nr:MULTISPECIES: hypothetical protein [unclassified Bradyrhizobium]
MFVSKGSGFDAHTTADSNLILNVSAKVSTLLLLGKVSATQTIALGLSRSPIVMVTTQNPLTGLPGYSGSGGPCRPSPLITMTPDGSGGYIVGISPPGAAIINGNGASLTVSCSGPTVYAVYSKAFT